MGHDPAVSVLSVNGDGPRDAALAAFEALAASRRTSLRVDRDREVPSELIDRLCAVAQWAPNHHKTWPLRFAAFTGEGRYRLGRAIADALAASGVDDTAKLEKFRVKYGRSPVVLVVGSAPGDSPKRTAENRDGAAAGVQNLLLAATAAGLASFWSSGAEPADAVVSEMCHWEQGTTMVAVIYLGWPVAEVPAPERPAPRIVHVGA